MYLPPTSQRFSARSVRFGMLGREQAKQVDQEALRKGEVPTALLHLLEGWTLYADQQRLHGSGTKESDEIVAQGQSFLISILREYAANEAVPSEEKLKVLLGVRDKISELLHYVCSNRLFDVLQTNIEELEKNSDGPGVL